MTEINEQELREFMRLKHHSHELKINTLANFRCFGTRGSEVQILSPRPIFLIFNNLWRLFRPLGVSFSNGVDFETVESQNRSAEGRQGDSQSVYTIAGVQS
jgi:hypothetical protein